MKNFKASFHYFSKVEIALWTGSVCVIIISFFIFDGSNYLTLLASIIGITSLIFCAKGNSFGQFLMIVFSLLYGLISFSFSYYGEMLTYLGMTMPMAVISLISWIRNPHNGNKAEVKINHLSRNEWGLMWALTILITSGFYFILEYFNTANIIMSTISVTTSFIAVYLTFKRSPYYAIAYAANDIILVVLWVLATIQKVTYLSVVVCFATFLLNDIYGFINWRRMGRRQTEHSQNQEPKLKMQ